MTTTKKTERDICSVPGCTDPVCAASMADKAEVLYHHLDTIEIDASLLPRGWSRTTEAKVQQYMAAIPLAGIEVNPVNIVEDETGRMWLLDGFSCYEAHRRLNEKTPASEPRYHDYIAARVYKVDRADAASFVAELLQFEDDALDAVSDAVLAAPD